MLIWPLICLSLLSFFFLHTRLAISLCTRLQHWHKNKNDQTQTALFIVKDEGCVQNDDLQQTPRGRILYLKWLQCAIWKCATEAGDAVHGCCGFFGCWCDLTRCTDVLQAAETCQKNCILQSKSTHPKPLKKPRISNIHYRISNKLGIVKTNSCFIRTVWPWFDQIK